MNSLVRHSRLALAIVFLALATMAVVAGPTPAVHAANPSITASGFAGGVWVSGSGFTAYRTVQIQVRRYNKTTKTWQLYLKSNVKASGSTYKDPGGTFNTGLTLPQGTVHVVAQDLASHAWSNTVTAYAMSIK
jgi:hypothetical protein